MNLTGILQAAKEVNNENNDEVVELEGMGEKVIDDPSKYTLVKHGVKCTTFCFLLHAAKNTIPL